MTKMIKIESCFWCSEEGHHHYVDDCKYNELKDSGSDYIHPDCPLEDYKPCDCEPFQSCEKCAKKTEWLPISEMSENYKLYWLLDENNITGKGHQEYDYLIVYDTDNTPEEFGKPVMFTEIKPPEVPR